MFTTIALASNRVLVKGEDQFGTTGQMVLDASEWTGLKGDQDYTKLQENFDEAVTAFFAPLTEAAKALQTSAQVVTDPIMYVVVQEEETAVSGKQEVLHHLSRDSIILRLLEQDPSTERLIWVNDELEVLAAEAVNVPAWFAEDAASTDTE